MKKILLLGFFLAAFVSLGCGDTTSVEEIAFNKIPGMGTLSGMVTAPKPFQAAQVYAHHVEKNIVYMVYTRAGRYRAVNMFPGIYEVTVTKKGFATDPQTILVEADQNATVDIMLRESVGTRMTRSRGMGQDSGARGPAKQVSYDELYPPGPGRETVEKTCVFCHGANFLPGRPGSEAGWDAAIDLMTGGLQGQNAMIDPGVITSEKRKEIVAYLTKNFGPDAMRRSLLIDVDIPVDEEVLSKAQYVEFRLANQPPFTRRRAQEPNFDYQGNVWFTERGTPSAVGRLDPRTGIVTDFMNPDPEGSPHGLVADHEGFMWWAGRNVHLGRIHMETGEIKEYPVQQEGWHGHTPVLDSKQNIWFTMLRGNKIGKWNRETDEISLWDNPTPGGAPYGIVLDSQEKVWYAEFRRCKIAMFDPQTEEFTEYDAPSQPCLIRRLTVDANDIVWYGVYSGGKLGRIDPKSGEIVEYDIPLPYSRPYDVWPDHEGNLWITDDGPGGVIIKFEPETKRFTNYPSPQWADMPKVAITREGAIWYSPRSGQAAVGVLYPDVAKMELGAYF